MENCRRFLQEVTGKDAGGGSRAFSCLMILASDEGEVARHYLENVAKEGGAEAGGGVLAGRQPGREPEVCGSVYLSDAVLSVGFTNDFVLVDLQFEDCVDFEYLQAGELCREYGVLTNAEKTGQVGYSLVLSVVPKGEYDVFFVGIDGAWCFVSENPGEISRGIRLVFAREKFGVYEFGEKAVEGIVADAVEELQISGE